MPYRETEKKNNIIKVGDKVIITDSGEAYTTYVTWVVTCVDDPVKVAKYCYNSTPTNGTIGKVEYLATHDCDYRILAYIKTSRGYYLLNTDGIEPYTDDGGEIEENYF